MTRHRPIIRLSVVLAAMALVKGCGDGDSPAEPPPPESARPTTVTVTPATVTLSALGATARLSAEVRDQHGRVMAGTAVAWESSDAAVATVDALGLVTGVSRGTATITARAGSGQGTAEITVMDPDRAALMALYEATGGPHWVKADNWLTDVPLGDWHGVATDDAGRVLRLELHRNNLVGPIPPELGNLARLERLRLFRNSLSGPIPAELGSLARLAELLLGDNNLSGSIPAELGNLTRLAELWLDGNNLTGPVPRGLLQIDELTEFLFGRNPGLCVPGTSDFAAWLRGMEGNVDGPYCNESDMEILELVHETTGGPNWTDADGWLETPALEEWYGVTADSLGHVVALDLAGNGLEGRLPANVASLAELTTLRIGDNALAGRLPLSLARLSLIEFHYAGTDLCVPTEATFQTWLNRIASHVSTGVECGRLSDREVLVALYDATDGPNWSNAGNWLTAAPLGEWYGVTTGDADRVVRLDLGGNNLSGPLPAELGSLTTLAHLVFTGNNLSGPIPAELGNLTRLLWLGLAGNDLAGSVPAELGSLASLGYLVLTSNDLSGPIPPELGNLGSLEGLRLGNNHLMGPIPPELGSLVGLTDLFLDGNNLAGPIPAELGNLTSLRALGLSDNNFTGPIPPELGSLADLRELWLRSNDLSGPVPPELGALTSLIWLYLDNNGLTGPVPPEFGGMTSLTLLSLTNNPGMSGALPARLTELNLEALLAGGTDLCAPPDPDFQAWLRTFHKRRIASCGIGGTTTMAYLTQTVQSPDYPVPLVAGEKALLRVFVTAAHTTTSGIPPVRARLYLNGNESHVADIPAQTTPIPTEIAEHSLSLSANAEIPAEIVQPGLEMVIEIDPDGTLPPSLGVPTRIPETGRMAIEVHELPVFDLTVIPFLWSPKPDSLVLDITAAMAADPHNHDLLAMTRTLLPVEDLVLTLHDPVLTSRNHASPLLGETEAIRVLEGGRGHYMGTMTGDFAGNDGRARQHGRSIFAKTDGGRRSEFVIAHELGHNMGLQHPPGCNAGSPDLSFPYANGRIGVWGYDFDNQRLIPPTAGDLMSYCGHGWISDYHFTNAIRYRLFDEGPPPASAKSLLLWGGRDAEGGPFLNPAFVVDAPPALPDSAGEHRITGRAANGDELFSLGFTVPEVADGMGSSSFAFVVPVQPGWADNLSSITLAGPGGSTTLDRDSNFPMAILLDPGTGRVRAILRDMPQADAAAALALQASPDGLDVLFSRGIPD
ncbi:MAG: hypothetical protein F4037_02485 [Gemmatimonadales bacterium]|nr:hypothetical protein [Candidatus Palauibacter ramosifaciens]